MKLLRAAGQHIMELLYPSHAKCMGCGDLSGTDSGWLCDACAAKVKELRIGPANQICSRCGMILASESEVCLRCKDWGDKAIRFARCVYAYDQPISSAIREMKYHGVYKMTHWMGQCMAEKLAELLDKENVSFLIPVPMHSARLRERGQNHALCLAYAISEITGIPVWQGLERVKNTKQQAKLELADRKDALKGAFRVSNGEEIRGHHVVLVDDVMTTGETVNACAEVLYSTGVKIVDAITLAGHKSDKTINSY